ASRRVRAEAAASGSVQGTGRRRVDRLDERADRFERTRALAGEHRCDSRDRAQVSRRHREDPRGARERDLERAVSLSENLMHFGRLLRGAGLSVGPGQIMLTLRAAVEVGPERREDFFWALASVFVSRHEELELFTQAFETFWRDPFRQEQLLSLLLSQ